VKITRNCINIVTLGLICVLLATGLVWGDQIFAPECLWDKKIAEKTDPIEIANTHLGIPYRADGALDSKGHFTTFAEPTRFFETPGLNCSGLVVSASRFLFDKNWTLEEVTRDRQGNSGPGSSMGKDWDFGWDLIMNLSEGRSRKIMMPDGKAYSVENSDGSTLVGFDLNDQHAWRKVMAQMRPGRVYLGSISKPARKKGYKILHYHVVLILPDGKGGVWLYHATHRSNVHRMNINSPQGMNRLMSQFRGNRDDSKKILIVEATLPDLSAPVQASREPQGQYQQTSKRGSQDAKPTVDASSSLAAKSVPRESNSPKPEPHGNASIENGSPQAGGTVSGNSVQTGPNLVINHLSGKVFKVIPDLVTSIPHFSDGTKTGIRFRFSNRGNVPRDVHIILQGPGGAVQYKGSVPPDNGELTAVYPKDFGQASTTALRRGKYLEEIRIDGVQWCADMFEVALPREANPKILTVKVPPTVRSGQTFSVTVEAENKGAESDYGGITVSSPQPAGLKLISAKPGRIYGPGSTVLSVTTDRIRTKVPMAERWIELWGENKRYELGVRIQAGRPGTYPLYVRCALRGVNVKSSVVLMEPSSSEAIDQQGFPVKVYNITVR
jgi:hypothetical protein